MKMLDSETTQRVVMVDSSGTFVTYAFLWRERLCKLVIDKLLNRDPDEEFDGNPLCIFFYAVLSRTFVQWK